MNRAPRYEGLLHREAANELAAEEARAHERAERRRAYRRARREIWGRVVTYTGNPLKKPALREIGQWSLAWHKQWSHVAADYAAAMPGLTDPRQVDEPWFLDYLRYARRWLTRPDRPGSPYNVCQDTAGIAVSWLLGLDAPLPLHALRGTERSMERRAHALGRLAAACYEDAVSALYVAQKCGACIGVLPYRVLGRVAPKLSTADLRRLSRLRPAALRALLSAGADVAWVRRHGERLRVMWDVVHDLLALLTPEVRERYMAARLPARLWLRLVLRGYTTPPTVADASQLACWLAGYYGDQSYECAVAAEALDEIDDLGDFDIA